MVEIRFLRFLAVGVVNTVVGLTIIYASMFAGASAWLANALGYGVGIIVGFLLNKNLTFRHRGGFSRAFRRYLAVNAIAYGANLGAVLLAISQAGIAPKFAQLVGVPIYTVIAYVGSRWYVFTDAAPANRQEGRAVRGV